MSTIAQDEYVTRVRREISDLDRQLVDLVNKRLKLVSQLKRYKEEHGIGFVDLAREEWMLQYLQRGNRGPLSAEGLAELYHELLDLMKGRCRRVAASGRAGEAGPASSGRARGGRLRGIAAAARDHKK